MPELLKVDDIIEEHGWYRWKAHAQECVLQFKFNHLQTSFQKLFMMIRKYRAVEYLKSSFSYFPTLLKNMAGIVANLTPRNVEVEVKFIFVGPYPPKLYFTVVLKGICSTSPQKNIESHLGYLPISSKNASGVAGKHFVVAVARLNFSPPATRASPVRTWPRRRRTSSWRTTTSPASWRRSCGEGTSTTAFPSFCSSSSPSTWSPSSWPSPAPALHR